MPRIESKDIPTRALAAIKATRFKLRETLEVDIRDSFYRHVAYGRGQRGTFILFDQDYQMVQRITGAWGGPNMFSGGDSAVDTDFEKHELPPGHMALRATEGGKYPGIRDVTVHPDHPVAIEALKAADKPSVLLVAGDKAAEEGWSNSVRLCWLLYMLWGYKAKSRREKFSRMEHPPTDREQMVLVDLKLIKVNSAGAVKVTAKGKNVLDDLRINKGWTLAEHYVHHDGIRFDPNNL